MSRLIEIERNDDIEEKISLITSLKQVSNEIIEYVLHRNLKLLYATYDGIEVNIFSLQLRFSDNLSVFCKRKIHGMIFSKITIRRESEQEIFVT